MKYRGYNLKILKLPRAVQLCLALVLAATLAQANWSWTLPVAMYKELDFSQRASLDRATESFKRAEQAEARRVAANELIPFYRNAAAEWKKFQLQYEMEAEDNILAYALFMQGYSLQLARDRNEAIKVYTELLDYYAEERWVSTAALYYTARAHYDNGDYRIAASTFQSLLDSPANLKHPLAVRTYKMLGELSWRELKAEEAIEYWGQGITEEYYKISRNDYNGILEQYKEALAALKHWPEYERLLFLGIKESNSKKRAQELVKNVNWIRNRSRHHWNDWYFNRFYTNTKERNSKIREWRGSAAEWVAAKEALFTDADMAWDHAMLHFDIIREYDAKEGAKMVPKIAAKLDSLGVAEDVRGKYADTFARKLCDYKMYDEARSMLQYVADTAQNLWLTYHIENHANNLPQAKMALSQLIANQDPEVSLKAKKSMAWFLKDRTKEYPEAIKLYTEISDPPSTLWAIQECYRRNGQKLEAYNILMELASIFPSEAAQATLTHAQYRQQDGEKEKAIALYRRLLSQPEWKKSRQSSLAHQALEKLGVDTGGAVIHEVR